MRDWGFHDSAGFAALNPPYSVQHTPSWLGRARVAARRDQADAGVAPARGRPQGGGEHDACAALGPGAEGRPGAVEPTIVAEPATMPSASIFQIMYFCHCRSWPSCLGVQGATVHHRPLQRLGDLPDVCERARPSNSIQDSDSDAISKDPSFIFGRTTRYVAYTAFLNATSSCGIRPSCLASSSMASSLWFRSLPFAP